MGTELVTVAERGLVGLADFVPAVVVQAGNPALHAWRDFFAELDLANANTARAYLKAIRQFLVWANDHDKELGHLMPGDVAGYLKALPLSPATKKQHRSALKRFFDLLVIRHICVINPVASVKTPRFKRTHGTTPMIEPDEIKQLRDSIDTATLAGGRDHLAIAILAYTAVRAGAVARLRRGDYRGRPGKRHLYFQEKGGNHQTIEVRDDLERYLDEYLARGRMVTADKDCPLIRPLLRTERKFRPWVPADPIQNFPERGVMTSHDLCRMVKRRMRRAGLREELSAHSFRVAVLTDLIDQGTDMASVQELAGHADARSTRLYDRTNRQTTRNLVERIRLAI